MPRPVTRAKNANQHPGKILLNLQPKKHSRAEVVQEREQLKLTKEELVQAMKLGLAAAAKVEDKNEEQDVPPPSQWHLARLSRRKSSLKAVPDSEDERRSVGSKGSKAGDGDNEPIDLMGSSQLDIDSMEASQAVNDMGGVNDDSFEESDEVELADTNLMEEASQAVGGINGVDEDVLELSDKEELVAKKKKKMGGLEI
ncbi:hypothetical protein SERLADRAFT_443421 [Serpula lacrymans var. lacrymans S7.9]|uniref:Uncharacterized protein n=1 Tax=Serpula lacrymans var. lacrymans (strain S7.9) TaxID=578457 RepID=F8PCG8_SERL9|nr:uncharacterized protein SERLADRAFT_443421 [Serpula lacrymans var. lacrymans S7.9]EGO19366.1 hypothetical protein SERLADRAFT_443421 [Serpula lacrymans var. lacrymans S7.9]